MKQSLKIALTLLISVIVSTVFVFLAFSGLFDFLQTTYYQPRVEYEYRKRLGTYSDSIRTYHLANIERFGPIVTEGFVVRAFLTQQSEEDIFNRRNTFQKLR